MNSKTLSDFSGNVSFDVQGVNYEEPSMVEEFEETNINLDQVLIGLTDNNGNNLNEQQIRNILQLGHFKIDNNIFMLIAEFGQLLREVGFEEAYHILSKSPIDEDFTWNNPSHDELRKFVESVQLAELSVIARDDLGFCNKCKSRMITVTYKQTSRGDEATSTIYRCASCKAGEKYIRLTDNAKDLIKQLINEQSK